jgi:DNA-binding XRE family transcriptional regulator
MITIKEARNLKNNGEKLFKILCRDYVMDKNFETITRNNCGRILSELRNRYGKMSIMDLAKILGVSRSTIIRIEDGRTLPSDEFMNRLKAVQIIGTSKFQSLSEKEKTYFSQLIEDIGEDPKAIEEKLKGNMCKALTTTGVLVGLGAIGSMGAIIGAAAVAMPPLAAISVAGYGLVKGMQAIFKANDLKCTEVDGRWEIIKTK